MLFKKSVKILSNKSKQTEKWPRLSDRERFSIDSEKIPGMTVIKPLGPIVVRCYSQPSWSIQLPIIILSAYVLLIKSS